jgi:ubiquinone/menaquinone biosynthesis C-methylase UbiE/DNA-binding transcriptional ArsR family regulator
MNVAAAPILDQLSVLADSTRCRVLGVLEAQELTVSELCDVLQLPQSTVSRHLKTLGDAGWVLSRRDGTSRFYAAALEEQPPAHRRLWRLVHDEVSETPAALQDEARLKQVVSRRRAAAEAFFSSAAGQWDRVRDELFGASAHLRALLGLLNDQWVVGDLGCGTGQVCEAIAPHVARVVAVDGSREMLHAARERLRAQSNVELRRGSLERLPLDDQVLDAALLVLVLHYLPDPARALAEAHRVLKPGGRLLVVDMQPHERDELRHTMGLVWMGFSAPQLARLCEGAGFASPRVHLLPPDPRAKGPSLLTATAWRSD